MREWPCVINRIRNTVKLNLRNAVPKETEFVDAFEVGKIHDVLMFDKWFWLIL